MRPNLMRRLALLEVAASPQAWQHTQGLAALLVYAQTLPARDPWDLQEVSDSGLGRLLQEARQRRLRSMETLGGEGTCNRDHS